MNIYIDESGTFVSTSSEGSWNCVAAYMVPETESRKAKDALLMLKRKSKVVYSQELKLRETREEHYLEFLKNLGGLDALLFCVATDSSFNNLDDIYHHQGMQVASIRKNVKRMKHESGKRSVQQLSNELESLSPQLYAQLHCQINLIDDLLRRGVLYFVQRKPKSLGKFKWRVDQKNSEKPVFEVTFRKLAPALLQSKTIDDPAIFLEIKGSNLDLTY